MISYFWTSGLRSGHSRPPPSERDHDPGAARPSKGLGFKQAGWDVGRERAATLPLEDLESQACSELHGTRGRLRKLAEIG